MNHKRLILAVLAALVVLAMQPVCSFAAPDSAQTDVTATAESRFEFTLPPDATVTYPDTTALVGQFTINNIFIESDEQLSVELVPGLMRARGYAGEVLRYSVEFNPPFPMDESHIGQSYDVWVAINGDDFDAATRTFYDAALEFRVRSTLTGEVIWRGATTVTAFKAQGGGGGGQDDDEGGGGGGGGGVVPPDTGEGGGVVPPDTGDDTLSEEPVPQASPGTGQPEGGQPGVVIPEEEIPAAQQAQFDLWWWWIPVAALAALLLILLLVLWRRRRREEEQSG